MKANWLIKAFKELPTGTISDAMDFLKIPSGVIVNGPKLLNVKSKRMAGIACTIQQMPKRQINPGKTQQLDVYNSIAKEGEVVVIDASGRMDAATTGGLQVTRALIRGLGGIVLNGCCRDAEDIVNMNVPFFCKGTVPRKSVPLETVGVNVPITVCNVQIRPGDIVVGDMTGIVIVPMEKAEEIFNRAKFIKTVEDEMEKRLLKGEDYSGLRQCVEKEISTK